MPVTCSEHDRRMTAQVSGELDHHEARAVMDELARQIDLTLPKELTLDLKSLSFTDSSGIAVVLRTWRRMAQIQGAMRVVNTPNQAEKVFRAAGLQKLITFE